MPFQNIHGLWGPSLIVLEKNEDIHTYIHTYIQAKFIYIEIWFIHSVLSAWRGL